VLSDRVQLRQTVPQLLKLVDLLVSQLFSLLVLLLQLGELLCEVGQPLRRVLHLLEHVGLALLNQSVQLFLSS